MNLYKPLGWTSHDCVAKVRRLTNQKKVGHGGTLDPAACGVLPIALGRATRLLQFLPTDKAYRAVVRFGQTTTTDDLEGDVIHSTEASHLTQAAAITLLSEFVGTIEQVPPRYSAIQVQGQRLYDLARQGQTFEVPTRTVTIHRIEPIDWQAGKFPELTLDIVCSAGTYIRAIARDLGHRLGIGGTLAALERTKSSGFTLDSSSTLEQLASQLQADEYQPISPAIALQHHPRILLPADLARRWQQGQKIPYQVKEFDLGCTCYQVYGPNETFLGMTEWAFVPDTDEIRLLPKVVFAPPS
ncbi:MAG: tRNA pseudouridine(55) synthase TruB [Leptolyngbyaceae cyanobacterium]